MTTRLIDQTEFLMERLAQMAAAEAELHIKTGHHTHSGYGSSDVNFSNYRARSVVKALKDFGFIEPKTIIVRRCKHG